MSRVASLENAALLCALRSGLEAIPAARYPLLRSSGWSTERRTDANWALMGRGCRSSSAEEATVEGFDRNRSPLCSREPLGPASLLSVACSCLVVLERRSVSKSSPGFEGLRTALDGLGVRDGAMSAAERGGRRQK